MNEKDGTRKINIDYPCLWVYKVIGSDETTMRTAIAEAIPGGCEITTSRSSAGGKYVSLTVTVRVEDEIGRTSIYEALLKDLSVKVVL
jgi:uncharacterized protein